MHLYPLAPQLKGGRSILGSQVQSPFLHLSTHLLPPSPHHLHHHHLHDHYQHHNFHHLHDLQLHQNITLLHSDLVTGEHYIDCFALAPSSLDNVGFPLIQTSEMFWYLYHLDFNTLIHNNLQQQGSCEPSSHFSLNPRPGRNVWVFHVQCNPLCLYTPGAGCYHGPTLSLSHSLSV